MRFCSSVSHGFCVKRLIPLRKNSTSRESTPIEIGRKVQGLVKHLAFQLLLLLGTRAPLAFQQGVLGDIPIPAKDWPEYDKYRPSCFWLCQSAIALGL